MTNDELSKYLQSLEDEDAYRVDFVLKQNEVETTQRVFRRTPDGDEHGPYIRKYIARDSGMGAVYQRIFEANESGQRFTHLPFILDCHMNDQATVVVMEHVNGQTLADVVYERDPGVRLAAEMFPALCDAVSELHESFDPPIIHRDLKPSNIMVRNGVPVIIDFGIAREMRESAEADTTHLGTREYAPPEQYGYEQTTVRSDVYALGLLLYYLLVEQTPTAKVIRKRFEDPRIPVELQRVMTYATAFDPKERYESATELKTAFQMAIAACAPVTAAMATPKADALRNEHMRFTPQTMATAATQEGQSFPSASPAPSGPPPAMGYRTPATSPRTGLARNIVVVVLGACLTLASLSFVIDPSRSTHQYPLLYHVYMFGICEPALFALTAYALLDKQGLRARHPNINWPTGSATRKIFLIGLGVLILFAGIIGFATGAISR